MRDCVYLDTWSYSIPNPVLKVGDDIRRKTMHDRKAYIISFICFHNLLLASKNQPFVKSAKSLICESCERDLPSHNILYRQYVKQIFIAGFGEFISSEIFNEYHGCTAFPLNSTVFYIYVYLKTKCSTNIWTPVIDIINKYLHFS